MLQLLTVGRPKKMLYFEGGIGDSLMCAAILSEFCRRGVQDVHLALPQGHLELFAEDRLIRRRLHPVSGFFSQAAGSLRSEFLHLGYENGNWELDVYTPLAEHIITIMARKAGLVGDMYLHPSVLLTKAEQAEGHIVDKQIAIHTSSLSARSPMMNKEWHAERFQVVVDRFKSRYRFVQIGSPADPVLTGAIDLRGKTTLRQSAAVLHNSVAFVGLEGGLMHLARAVECRSVIVFGGRLHPYQSGYSCNENLYWSGPCAPCWSWNRCDHGRRCMDEISAEQAVDALSRQLERFGEPIERQLFSVSLRETPIGITQLQNG